MNRIDVARRISRLGIGTVQFGMPYGINNDRGQVPYSEVLSILETAVERGVTFIDPTFPRSPLVGDRPRPNNAILAAGCPPARAIWPLFRGSDGPLADGNSRQIAHVDTRAEISGRCEQTGHGSRP